MRMLELPEDIESTCLGSGCPNDCWYCYETKEVIYNGIPEFIKDKIYLYDMNIFAYPDPYKILVELGETKKYFELSSGIDWRRLDLPKACLLRKYRFGRFNKKNSKWQRYIRFAWDFQDKLQFKMLDCYKTLLTAGFKPNQIGVFMLVNGKDCDLQMCIRKLDTLKYWGVQVDDCCYDGGYPESEKEFYDPNGRFEGKRYWSYDEIKNFRKICRKHNQKVTRLGIDPELK
jgi:hypothetical protein